MRSSFSLSASQNEKRSTSKIMGLLRKKCGMPLHFIVDFHSLSTSKMLKLQGVGSVVRIETSRFFFVIRSVLHRCQAAQRKNGPFVTLTWATDCSNASFSRFRLLTLANPHEFASIGFHWGYLGCHHHPAPNIPRRQIGRKLRDYYLIQSWWFIDVGFFLPFFLRKTKKNKEFFSRRSSPLYFPSMIQKMMSD